MFTCSTLHHATLEVKQSRFIAHLVPYRVFETHLEALRHEHPKARHFVTAFRYLNDHDQIVEGSSDDGEPKGTSGKPSLHVLQGHELINVAVIIVRYFGGTKLGTGGLVRAYGDAVNLVLSETVPEPYVKLLSMRCRCSYNDLGRVEYAITHAGAAVSEKDFEVQGVVLTLLGTQLQLDSIKQTLNRIISQL